MDTFSFFDALQSALVGHLPAMAGALLLLLAGWLVALLAAAASRNLLSRISLNQRLGEATGQTLDAELIVSRLLFWLVLMFVLVAVFNGLNLMNVSEPLANMLNEVLVFLPRFFAGMVLVLIGWTLASLARAGISRLMDKTSLDEKLSAEAGMAPLSSSIGHVAYWLILLMFLPMVLNAWQLEGLMHPVQGIIDQLLGYLPNLVAAIVIGLVGYILARVVRGLVTNLLEASRLPAALQELGMHNTLHIPRLIGTLTFLVIFIPVLIAALNALQIETISRPATQVLDQIMAAIPSVMAAALILLITYYVARFAAQLLGNLLAGVGINELPAKMGLQKALGDKTLLDILGFLLVFFAMLFATVEAANRLAFTGVRDIITAFILFGGDVLLGVVMLSIGFWLANIVADAVNRSQGSDAPWLSGLVRALIIGLVLAMGLRAMGLADSIVNLAFGLTLGAIAVAFALAFGLGGREAAGRLLDRWLKQKNLDP